MPQPSVEQMLSVAHGVGLTWVEEAYFNYQRFYDVFFSIENIDAQTDQLHKEMRDKGLLTDANNAPVIVAELISDAMVRLSIDPIDPADPT